MQGNVEVYEELKEHIQFLELKPGERVVEAELSKQFGVSRTPVREALKRLEEEQLIEIYPQRGTYVARINAAMIREMAYMRHILEEKVLLDLCEKRMPVRQAVEGILLMMKLALKNGDCKAYIQQDILFHRALFICAGHQIMWDTIAGTMTHYSRILSLDMALPNHLKESYDSHERIVECIEEGHSEELRRLLEDHHDYRMSEEDRKMIEQYPKYFQ